MFEKAPRIKLRFLFEGEEIDVEDLWDLEIEDISNLYMFINCNINAINNASLLGNKDERLERMELQIKILKHIYDQKVLEDKQEIAEVGKQEKRCQIDKIIEKKRESELEGKTIEELTAMRDEL
jgi:hypothetical protein